MRQFPDNSASPPVPVTLFSIPKAFTGHIGVIQRNALRSWTLLEPRPRIILFGDDEGVAEICRELGLLHVPEIERNDRGTPLIHSIFASAQQLAETQCLAYVNTDIILLSEFAHEVNRLPRDGNQWLAVGRRHDLMVWDEIDFRSPEWEATLYQRVRREGLLDASSGIDYFIFPKGLYSDIPPFAVGRTFWDNWLLWHALQKSGRMIDATRRIMAIHQDHPYTHAKGGAQEIWNGNEARRNWELAQGHAAIIRDANYCLNADGVVPMYEAYRHPEPMMQDVNDFKYRQSIAAYVRGRNDIALDLLDYIALWSPGNRLPEGYRNHKAKVLMALGQMDLAFKLLGVINE